MKAPPYQVEWRLHLAAGGSWVLPVRSWSIRRSRKEPLSWDCVLPMTADLRRTGTIGQHLAPTSYDASWTLQKWLTCEITLGEESWPSPKLAIKTRRIRVAKNEKMISLSGIDRFEPLLERDVVENDVRSEEDGLIMAKAVIIESLLARGIASPTLDFTDFAIRTFHRTGVPMSYLREIWDVYQCDTFWNGDTFTVRAGGLDPAEQTADYTLTDGEDCVVIDYQESDDDCITEVTVERPRELRRGTAEPIVGKALGPVSVTLEVPSYYALARIQLFAPGYHGDWVWDDEEDTPLTTAPNFLYMGSVKAAKLRFNIYPPVGSDSLDEIPYSVEIVIDDILESLGGYEEDVSYTAINEAAQALIGVRRPDSPLTMQHVPNQSVAQAAAEAHLVEELLNYETIQTDGPLLKFIDPGMTCAFSSSDLDLVAHKMRTQTVEYRQDSKSLMVSVGLGRGPHE